MKWKVIVQLKVALHSFCVHRKRTTTTQLRERWFRLGVEMLTHTNTHSTDFSCNMAAIPFPLLNNNKIFIFRSLECEIPWLNLSIVSYSPFKINWHTGERTRIRFGTANSLCRWVSGLRFVCRVKSLMQTEFSKIPWLVTNDSHSPLFDSRRGLTQDQTNTNDGHGQGASAWKWQIEEFSTRPDGTTEFLYYAPRVLRRCTSFVPVQWVGWQHLGLRHIIAFQESGGACFFWRASRIVV